MMEEQSWLLRKMDRSGGGTSLGEGIGSADDQDVKLKVNVGIPTLARDFRSPSCLPPPSKTS
eukprot:763226-Hanusia_phi.AAC.1